MLMASRAASEEKIISIVAFCARKASRGKKLFDRRCGEENSDEEQVGNVISNMQQFNLFSLSQ